LAEARGLKLSYVIPEGVKCLTLPARLRSSIMNLLGNAIEYNRPTGMVALECAVDAGRSLISIRVIDSGPGIAPEHAGHVFEPFYRADKSRARAEGHLGLGLSLVRAHAEALGGRCHVDSTPGVGSTFTIEFTAADVIQTASASADREKARSHGPLIKTS
jgi:signal transduction histidine kinase